MFAMHAFASLPPIDGTLVMCAGCLGVRGCSSQAGILSTSYALARSTSCHWRAQIEAR